MHVLFPGRLVEQKDPLLMVDVAAALRDRAPGFQIHAVGEGDARAGGARGGSTSGGWRSTSLIHPRHAGPRRAGTRPATRC